MNELCPLRRSEFLQPARGAPERVEDPQVPGRIQRGFGALDQLPIDLASESATVIRSGDFPAGASLIAEADVVSEATGTGYPPFAALWLACMSGQEAEATLLIESTIAEGTAGGQGHAVSFAQCMAAILGNSLGRYADALAAAQRASEDLPELYVSMWALPELIEAAVRSRNTPAARQALERLAETTQAGGTDFGLGIEARSRALLSEGETADGLYREAIERLGRTRLRAELARAHLLYGEWLRREDRRTDARAQLRAAYQMLAAMGAAAFAERARRELLAAGDAVRKLTVETRTELTAQEASIARLAQGGLTNTEIGAQLFLSARTVEWHLGTCSSNSGSGHAANCARRWPASRARTRRCDGRHDTSSELFFILDGRLDVLAGDDIVVAGPGDLLVVPPGRVHAFGGPRDSAAEALIIITPGVERFGYFLHVARWREAREPRDILLGLQDRFDTHFTDSTTWDRARAARAPPREQDQDQDQDQE